MASGSHNPLLSKVSHSLYRTWTSVYWAAMEKESRSRKSFKSKSTHRLIVDNIKRSMLKCILLTMT